MSFSDSFSLSVSAALRDQLDAGLSRLEPAPLTEMNLARVQATGGIYQLFESGRLVYVGKSGRNLRARLSKHHWKLSGRSGNVVERTSFRCLYVAEDLDSLAPEKMLIAKARSAGEAEWNTNGFGNNDPGRKRDTSLVAQNHFDRLFPINLDIGITLSRSGGENLGELLAEFKRRLPYNFRYQNDDRTRAKLRKLEIKPFPRDMLEQTVASWLTWFAERLPSSWVIVALPGYLIAYEDLDETTCDSRTAAWRRGPSGAVLFTSHRANYGDELSEPVDPDTD